MSTCNETEKRKGRGLGKQTLSEDEKRARRNESMKIYLKKCRDKKKLLKNTFCQYQIWLIDQVKDHKLNDDLLSSIQELIVSFVKTNGPEKTYNLTSEQELFRANGLL
jgi:uncharacterized membrane-anchored protein YjiN (DUF445 family)